MVHVAAVVVQADNRMPTDRMPTLVQHTPTACRLWSKTTAEIECHGNMFFGTGNTQVHTCNNKTKQTKHGTSRCVHMKIK
jgi:hypothetical protein